MPREIVPPREDDALLLIISWAAGSFDPSTRPWNPVLPERFARPAWNPERSDVARAGWTQALWAVAPTKIPEPVLPEAFARPFWNPERTAIQRPSSVQSQWAVPPTKIPEPLLPESFARPPWRPERTELPRAGWTQSLWAVPPTFIPEPVLPQFFYARQVWNPDRSQLLWNPFQFGAVVVPTWGYEVLGPQAFLRPAWNPERTSLSRAAWTQATWAVPPTAIPEPVLPPAFARPFWTPERSQLSSVPLIIPRLGFSTVSLPERFARPVWNPERTGTIIAQRVVIAPAPLLSWTPQLLERFVRALRSPPSLDLFSPAIKPAAIVQLGKAMRGLAGVVSMSGEKGLVGMLGHKSADAIAGEKDGAAILGSADPSDITGENS
jgi:hypothetical protein